ncbi:MULTISPECIES: hypothetical protein [unclassified Azospirillum]|uniref:hypothetical protein n=1 Tax=unclassified Azospirillum TaxID=2630922 RepID=UPI000B74005D|nr:MULTISPECIES: hypothetical protein [unclassified Azospirillum]SNR92587.1 hypothetical protein SAMN05880556_101574 [Azospirillum sp. RU38E]SNS08539.1 hypothetical protein SAMN05880591_101574 [Azospirillum sp. RU37A]
MRQSVPPPSLSDLETAFPLLLGNGPTTRPHLARQGREKATSHHYEAETAPTPRRKTGLLDFLFGV